LRETARETATVAVKTRLVFDTIMEKENIVATQPEIDAEVEKLCTATKKKATEFTQNPAHMDYIEQNVRIGKLLKFLRENNKIV